MTITLNIKKVIKRHFGMTRKPTDQEVRDEIKDLLRRYNKGSLDDFSSPLFYALGLDDKDLRESARKAFCNVKP